MARTKQTAKKSGSSRQNNKAKAKAKAKAKTKDKGKAKEKEKVPPPFSALVNQIVQKAKNDAREYQKARKAKEAAKKKKKKAEKRKREPSPPPPPAKKRKTTDRRIHRFSTVWCSLSAALKHAPDADQKKRLQEKLDTLSVAMTMAQRMASEASIIDVLQALNDPPRDLPKLDQDYYRTLLAAINPAKYSIKEGTEKFRLFQLVSEMETFPWIQGELERTGALNGVAELLNVAARQMATMSRNSVCFRIWKFQRDRLKDLIRNESHNKTLPTIPGPDLQTLLTDLQLFLRNPGNKKQNGDYGFKAPYGALNTILQEEFSALPVIPGLNGPITRKVLATHFLLFLPYIKRHLETVEQYAALYQQEKEKKEKTQSKARKRQPGGPFIGTRKTFSILPLYNFTRKMVLFNSTTWAHLLRTLKIPLPLEPNPKQNACWFPLQIPGSQKHRVIQISTNGVKITFTRAIPKSITPSGDSVDDDEAEEDDEDGNDNNEVDEDAVDLDALAEPTEENPIINIMEADPGLYSHATIDFAAAPVPPAILGVDPGRGNVFTFREECHCQEDCTCRQRALDRHKALKDLYGDRYILQPHGLSSKAYHHLIGTYWYQRLIQNHQRQYQQRQSRKDNNNDEDQKRQKDKEERKQQAELLTAMTFKSATLETIYSSVRIEAFLQLYLYPLYTSKQLARAKFTLLEKKRVFFLNLAFSLDLRFPDKPVVAFGSAAIHPTRFKGHPATPVSSTKRVFGSIFRCILTPEPYTSQKCCLCHQQLKAQEHRLEKLQKTKEGKVSEKLQKKAFQGIVKVHGALMCRNKEAHGGRFITWSRDINASGNMTAVVRYSYESRCYLRPPYLTSTPNPLPLQ